MTERQQAQRFQQDYLKRIRGGLQIARLLETLPMVAFFAKDERSRFVCGNARTLEIMGIQHEWQMLGKMDWDFFPHEVAAGYVEEDQQVMRSGKAITRYTQMVPDSNGPLHWYVVSKIALRDAREAICGVAVTMYEIHEVSGVALSFQRLEPALRHLHIHFRESIETPKLAALTNLSESQFTRLFRKLFGEAPMRYLIRQRIHAACQDLIATNHTAGTIAVDCGFYDQSAFIRAFRAITGKTPAAYRKSNGALLTHRKAIDVPSPRGRSNGADRSRDR